MCPFLLPSGLFSTEGSLKICTWDPVSLQRPPIALGAKTQYRCSPQALQCLAPSCPLPVTSVAHRPPQPRSFLSQTVPSSLPPGPPYTSHSPVRSQPNATPRPRLTKPGALSPAAGHHRSVRHCPRPRSSVWLRGCHLPRPQDGQPQEGGAPVITHRASSRTGFGSSERQMPRGGETWERFFVFI